MGHLTFAARLILPVSAAVLLAGCGDGNLTRTFGLSRDAPDEFTVVTRAPLSMPPDYTLRPPQPGALRPQEQSDRAAAESALVPEAALGGNVAGVSRGQVALLRDAGGSAPADIRQRVDQESRLAAADSTLADKILFWRKPGEQGTPIDPALEAQRLRQNAALGQPPVAGDTPVIQKSKGNWFDRLLSAF